MISIVIRTKDEEEWIGRCLDAVFSQDHPSFEVILVDNESKDATLSIASDYDVKVVPISAADFTFGRSLNVGFREARGDLIAAISGHCVPVNDRWLQCMQAAFDGPRVAGVYGRQEPLPDSDAFNRRDLWTTFGTERRRQSHDIFFHNANSMVRADIWRAYPFDEEIQGVEDREWAKRVLAHGYTIVYEPSATVYHHHGIHHSGDLRRAERVARVIQSIQEKTVP